MGGADKLGMLRRGAFRCLVPLAFSLLGWSNAFAEDSPDLANLSLSQLADIPIVSAARHEQSRTGSPRAVSVVTAEEIRRRNYRNVPEALATLPGASSLW